MEEVHETARHFERLREKWIQNTFTGFTVSFSDLIVNVRRWIHQPLHGLFNDIATLAGGQSCWPIRGSS